MLKLQHGRKGAESALAEHVVGVEIAISQGNVQHMARHVYIVASWIILQEYATKDKAPETHPTVHQKD